MKNSENIRETDSDQTRYFLKAVFFHLKVKLAGANESKKFFSEDEMVGGGGYYFKNSSKQKTSAINQKA